MRRADAAGVHLPDAQRLPGRHAEDMRPGERHAPPAAVHAPAAARRQGSRALRRRRVHRRPGRREEAPRRRRRLQRLLPEKGARHLPCFICPIGRDHGNPGLCVATGVQDTL